MKALAKIHRLTGHEGANRALSRGVDYYLNNLFADDGLPKPRIGEKGSDGQVTRGVDGVRVRWILFRGPGNVQFDPEVTPAVYGKPLTAETKVTFSAPGDYWIRAIASDVALFSFYDINVKVNPGTSSESKAR